MKRKNRSDSDRYIWVVQDNEKVGFFVFLKMKILFNLIIQVFIIEVYSERRIDF